MVLKVCTLVILLFISQCVCTHTKCMFMCQPSHDLVLCSPSSAVQGNDIDNLNLAFEVAEKHLDIPKMLDAEGIVNLEPFMFASA